MRSASVGLLSAGPTMPPSTYGSSSQGINLHHNGGSTAIPSSSMQPQIPSPPEIILDPRPIAGRPSGRRYLRGKILGKAMVNNDQLAVEAEIGFAMIDSEQL